MASNISPETIKKKDEQIASVFFPRPKPETESGSKRMFPKHGLNKKCFSNPPKYPK